MVAYRNDIFRWIVTTIILLLFVTNIRPMGLFAKIGTRDYISVIGCIYLFANLHRLPGEFFQLMRANLVLVFFSIITMLINRTLDIWYIQFAIRNILYLNGAFFVSLIAPRSCDFIDWMMLIVIVMLINNLLATIAFFSPTIMHFLTSFQTLRMENVESSLRNGNRMIGLGSANYFVGGTYVGFALIFLFHILTEKRYSTFFISFLIVFLTISGLFIARTTLVGLLCGIFLSFLNQSFQKVVGVGIISSLIVLFVVNFYLFESVNYEHAFEVFNKPLTEIHSLQHLQSMADRNIDFGTLMIGDGLSKYTNGRYYMHVDIGYLRNIFYFGLFGTIFGYFYYAFVLLRTLYFQWSNTRMLTFILAIYLVILNIKGLPDFNFMIFLLCAIKFREYYDMES